MHHRFGIVALLCSMAALSVAPRARADGFFVTFSPGQRSSPAVARIAGASFDASGTSPIDPGSGLSAGRTQTLPVHIEVDDVRPLAPLLSDETRIENIPLVTVEFTTPDAAGVEQVVPFAVLAVTRKLVETRATPHIGRNAPVGL